MPVSRTRNDLKCVPIYGILKVNDTKSLYLADAQHIAIASVERVDVLVSWNFKQIVNLDRIHAFNAVNIKLGYPILEIRSPMEVLHEEEI